MMSWLGSPEITSKLPETVLDESDVKMKHWFESEVTVTEYDLTTTNRLNKENTYINMYRDRPFIFKEQGSGSRLGRQKQGYM